MSEPSPSLPPAAIRPPAMLLALLLTAGLFLVGGRPEASHYFPGPAHWIAHFGTYGLIAAAYARALPRLGVLPVAALVMVIGIVHEYYEIGSHGHDFEYLDAAVNGLGALAGSFAGRISWPRRPRS